MHRKFRTFVGAALLLVGAMALWADPPSLETDKFVDPAVIYLEGTGTPDEATVTLTVSAVGDPQVEYYPIDVVPVIDRSGSMGGQNLIDAKIRAVYFCSLLDSALDQSGLVSFSGSASLDQELTHDHSLTIAAINQLVSGGSTAIGSGIQLAQGELLSGRHRPDAKPVMMLLSDGNNNEGPDPIAAATMAKSKGIVIYALGLGDSLDEQLLREIASDPDSEYYYRVPSSEDLDSIYARLHQHFSYFAASAAFAVEILAESLRYVSGSFSINPIIISGDSAVWNLGDFNLGDSWAVSFNITATDTGHHMPVDDYPNAEVTYQNYLGQPASEPFPQRYIDVLLPTGLQEIGDSAGARVASMRAVPNPFSSSSAIHYSLIHRTQATLEIYNLTGELVRTLVAEVKPPGAHMVTWDTNDDLGRKVPSGVYLVRLRAGDLASTHKLVLMR